MNVQRGFALATAIAALVGFASVTRAVSVTYSDEVQTGSQVTMTSNPLSITSASIGGLYSAPVITSTASGFHLAFTPSVFFNAFASNANGGMSVITDGKIDFTLLFSAPVQLQATIHEGGTAFTTGTGPGSFSVSGGGVITEEDGPPFTATPNGNLAATFNPDNSWSGSVVFSPIAGLFSSFNFSIDNTLVANAFGGDPATAYISKDSFSIDINVTPAPLPSAAHAGLGLMGIGALAFGAQRLRRKAVVA